MTPPNPDLRWFSTGLAVLLIVMALAGWFGIPGRVGAFAAGGAAITAERVLRSAVMDWVAYAKRVIG